jgi:hypothetical protein
VHQSVKWVPAGTLDDIHIPPRPSIPISSLLNSESQSPGRQRASDDYKMELEVESRNTTHIDDSGIPISSDSESQSPGKQRASDDNNKVEPEVEMQNTTHINDSGQKSAESATTDETGLELTYAPKVGIKRTRSRDGDMEPERRTKSAKSATTDETGLELTYAPKVGIKRTRSRNGDMEPERRTKCTVYTLSAQQSGGRDVDWSDTSDSDATTDRDEKTDSEPELFIPRQRGTSKSSTWQRKQNAEYKQGLIDQDEDRLTEFHRKACEHDTHCEVIDTRTIRHSKCGKVLKMQMPYNLNNFKMHIKNHCNTTTCKGWKHGAGTETLKTLFARQSQQNASHSSQ